MGNKKFMTAITICIIVILIIFVVNKNKSNDIKSYEENTGDVKTNIGTELNTDAMVGNYKIKITDVTTRKSNSNVKCIVENISGEVLSFAKIKIKFLDLNNKVILEHDLIVKSLQVGEILTIREDISGNLSNSARFVFEEVK